MRLSGLMIVTVLVAATLAGAVRPAMAAKKPKVNSASAAYVRKANWFDSLAATVLAGRGGAIDKAMFDKLLADFTDAEDVRQMMIEQREIFARGANPRGSLGALALLYANACDEKLRDAARAMAGKVKTLDDLKRVRGMFYRSRMSAAQKLARATLTYVQATGKREAMAKGLTAVERKISAAGDDADWTALFAELCGLRRKIILSHPALRFEKLLINKHAPGAYSHNCDQYLGRHSRPGDGLVVLTNWKTSPQTKKLLAGKLPIGDTAHPMLSFDAKRVIFGFCDHTVARNRRFFIYEAATDGSSVRKLTGTDSDPMEGWGGRKTVLIEDFDPAYLPGGGFVFTSTRSQNFGRCHGGRYVPSYLLCRAELSAAGPASNIRQISYAEANEHYPSVLNDGRIVFTRWEYINRNQIAFHKLWWCRPDGTASSNFYGVNSATPWANNYHDTHSGGQKKWYNDVPDRSKILPFVITETRAIPDSSKVVAVSMGHHSYTAGCLVIIDPEKGEDGFGPLTKLTPEVPHPEAEDYFAAPGNYMTPCAVNEELFFASYSPYRIKKQRQTVPVNEYIVMLVDTLGGREPIYCDPAISCVSPTPMLARTTPPVIPSQLPDKPSKNTGTLILQNVYLTRNDPDGVIKKGEITHLRINEILPQPHTGARSAGSREDFARRILGTVPLNSDGSVIFNVPAKTAIHIQALDANGMAVLTERSLFHLMPGEVRSCVGCHEPVGTAPLAKFAARRQQPRELTPPVGPKYSGGFSFHRTVQPVLDRYCIRCHGLGKTEGKVNLLSNYGRDSRINGMPVKPRFDNSDAYATLTTRPGLIKMALRKGNGGVDSETVNSRPKDYFAHASKLPGMLMKGHDKAKLKLDRESFQRIVDWLDMNAVRYGDYGRDKTSSRKLNKGGEKALRAYIAECFGAKLAAQPIQSLVNVSQVDESRILKAPLALDAGGWGQIANGWKTTDDPRYKKMLALIAAAM